MRKIFFILLLFAQHVFAGDILTSKGYMPEEKIKVGDKVISPLGGINTITAVESMNKCWYAERGNQFNYVLINGKYKFFRDQSIYIGNGEKIYHAFELKRGDTIYDEKLKRIKITSIQIIDANKDWIRLTISGDHSYIDDGIAVHNAARFWIGQSGGGNYSSTDWSTTSGGGGGSAAPTSSDDVTFDGAGTFGNTNCTITATANAKTLTFTSGYTVTLTINSNIQITVAGNFTDNTAHTWTMGNSASTMVINTTATITSGGKTFPGAVQLTGTNTKTLSGDWTVSGLMTIGGTCTLNSNTLNLSGGLTMTGSFGAGSTLINLTGGTWSGSGNVSNSVTIAGNVTFSWTGGYSTGTLTYSSGTVTVNNSLSVNGSSTLNTNGITWTDVNLNFTSGTITINSLLTASATISNTNTNASAITFAGTSGFTCATFSLTGIVGACTVTLVNGVTYTITSSLQAYTSRTGAIILFTSDHATNKAILTLNAGAVCSVLADFTRIDCSNGRTVNTFHGTLTSTTNIFSYTDYGGGISASLLFCQ